MTAPRPRPWAGLAAAVAVVATLLWIATGGLSGFLGLIGIACVAAGWRSGARRWLVWLALLANAYVLVNSLLVVAS